jgi:hypothetical protein
VDKSVVVTSRSVCFCVTICCCLVVSLKDPVKDPWDIKDGNIFSNDINFYTPNLVLVA